MNLFMKVLLVLNLYGRIEDEIKLGEFNAIIPSVEGWAKITGLNTITIDDDDPYAHGFVGNLI